MVLAEVGWAWAVVLGSVREAEEKQGCKLMRNRACVVLWGGCSAELWEDLNKIKPCLNYLQLAGRADGSEGSGCKDSGVGLWLYGNSAV